MFRVLYDAPDGIRSYTVDPMELPVAIEQCLQFRSKYVGKPYPNGRGFYPFSNPRIIQID